MDLHSLIKTVADSKISFILNYGHAKHIAICTTKRGMLNITVL